MPAASAVPDQLLAAPFTLEQARRLGVSRKVLRGARFWTPAPGVRASATLPDTLALRCAAMALLLPSEAAFSHLTAARLCGLPVPGARTPLGMPVDEPLDITCTLRAPRGAGVRGHHADLSGDVREVGGLRVTSGARTWADLAPLLGLDDLIVLGDAIAHGGWADLASLSARASRPGRRGSRAMRAAIALLEPRSESPPETRLRLLLVRAGLPRPAANRDVVVDGAWLARPDLSYPWLRIAIEYDGDHHRTSRAQWQRDIGRRRVLEDAGWLLVVVTADDVTRRPHEIVERVRRAIAGRSA